MSNGSMLTLPATGPPSTLVSEKLAALMVEGSMASLKVALTRVLVPTPVTMGVVSAGLVDITVGAVLSTVALVVKFQT
ncbi:hypothetical protein GALL_551510 [mine drainage metagenome]|uniref:Uncharacterized protein n=1 Tax=mine drainage metagenome TaxID=410659 RepID=A0A1J5P779_9ZZZZ